MQIPMKNLVNKTIHSTLELNFIIHYANCSMFSLVFLGIETLLSLSQLSKDDSWEATPLRKFQGFTQTIALLHFCMSPPSTGVVDTLRRPEERKRWPRNPEP